MKAFKRNDPVVALKEAQAKADAIEALNPTEDEPAGKRPFKLWVNVSGCSEGFHMSIKTDLPGSKIPHPITGNMNVLGYYAPYYKTLDNPHAAHDDVLFYAYRFLQSFIEGYERSGVSFKVGEDGITYDEQNTEFKNED